MKTPHAKLSNEVLLDIVQRTRFEGHRVLAKLIVLLIEVEHRRLYAECAYPSLFAFCRTELGMSQGEAYRRINAARLVKKFPRLLPRIELGDIHLSALLELREHFTPANVDDLVAAAKGLTKLQLRELVARLAPRPDVPAKMRKIPQHDKGSHMTKATRPEIDPLSEARYRLQVTGGRSFRDKLLRARDLMSHSNPSGDLAVVVERALDALIEALEKQKYGKPLRNASAASLEEVPATLTPHAVGAADSSPSSTTKRGIAKRPGLARASTGARATARPARAGDPAVAVVGRADHDAGVHRRARKARREGSHDARSLRAG